MDLAHGENTKSAIHFRLKPNKNYYKAFKWLNLTFAPMLILSIAALPAIYSIIPFLLLLLLIAAGPVFFNKLWHKYYHLISIGLGLITASYYLIALQNYILPIEAISEYFSFISLLVILFVASGGIYLFIDIESTPLNNVKFLAIAAVLTNLIGTTGASILLIRPFMRMNRYRLKPYQIVFFIFVVSNVGGLLTPIGDPPLFIGFLKGVPFSWTILNLFKEWVFVNVLVLIVYYFFERKNSEFDEVDISEHYSNRIFIKGKQNFIWLGIGIVSVFIDPNLIDNLPHIVFHGRKLSYIREVIQLSAAFLCYKTANKLTLASNDFNFEPIKEVAYLFVGIFLCMMPALQLLENYAHVTGENLVLTPYLVYFSTGIFSSFLDNAPTYLNMFTLVLSKYNYSINNYADVAAFLQSNQAYFLKAISTASVFFGALTYIGNGPNFMVKSIAEQNGVKMPTFGKYIVKYSLLILLPILIITAFIFF